MTRRLPWVIKYRPKRIDEVVNQDKAKQALIPWIEAWASGRKPAKRAALLYGPPGVGKTSLVEAIAREYGFQLVELNASDYRRDVDIKRIVGSAARKRPLYGRGLIILLDEIDGIAPREDAGGLKALLEVIKETENPIVMTANDPWKEQLRPLRDAVLLVEFRQLATGHIVRLLERICKAERLYCEKDALKYIAEKSMGDVRAAINDLEAVAEGYGKVTLSLVKALVRGRDKSIDLWRTLNSIYYAKYAWQAKKAVTSSEEDYETLLAWLNDNTHRKYKEPEDLYRAYDALSRASLFLARAKYRGHWSMLSYVFDLMGPGVAFARVKGQVARERFSYPERIKLMAQLRQVRETREALAGKLAERILASRATIKREVIPFLTAIFRNSRDPTVPARIALGYNMTREEVKLLAGARAEEILKAAERIRKARPGEEGEKAAREERQAKPAGLDAFLGLGSRGGTAPGKGASRPQRSTRRRGRRRGSS